MYPTWSKTCFFPCHRVLYVSCPDSKVDIWQCCVFLSGTQLLITQSKIRKALRYHSPFEKSKPKTQPRDMIFKFSNSRKSTKNLTKFRLKPESNPLAKNTIQNKIS